MSMLQDQMKEMGQARVRVLQAMETAIDAHTDFCERAKDLTEVKDAKEFEQKKKSLLGEGKPIAKMWQAAQSAVVSWQSQISACRWALEVEKKEVEVQKEKLKNATKEAEAVNDNIKKFNDNVKLAKKIPIIGMVATIALKPKPAILLPDSAATMTRLVAGLMAAEAEIEDADNLAGSKTKPKLKEFTEHYNAMMKYINDIELQVKVGKR